ncbi:selenium metabolism-associated LysR family transcriptional regulator [Eubacterium oxidoreducens]|uniref:DNA-binding transcriptional regulator, LysR family n=1 Tax=Eubacterium oxidoreducens TaxID=1732 RepID=A0A1G6ANX6_EUBOX|nr:selenium metabolism-associated LysR family transcriptional regulator [Eubacterium oxidoreducens]SDB10027.1 DNA-binding transcriptional regulator, LysR family [Eubacterium oxidoreducens]
MEFRHLEVFVAVAELKSFSKAAEYLYLTQPTVSSHINSLEKELHIKLFNRTTKFLQITPEGEELYNYANRIIRLKNAALESISHEHNTTLRIGASSLPGSHMLPAIISKFYQKHPNVRFDIHTGDSNEIEDQVIRGVLDFGLVGSNSYNSNCIYEQFASDELSIAMPNTAEYRTILLSKNPLGELMKKHIIVREKGSNTFFQAQSYLAKDNIYFDTLNIIATVDDPELILKMVIQGMGISIFSNLAILQAKENGQILVYPLHTSSRQFYIMYQKERSLPAYADQFLEFVKKHSDN